MVRGMQNKPCEVGWKELGMFCLEDRIWMLTSVHHSQCGNSSHSRGCISPGEQTLHGGTLGKHMGP